MTVDVSLDASVENQPRPPDVSFGSLAAVDDAEPSVDGVEVEGVEVDGAAGGAGDADACVAGVLGSAIGVPIVSLTTGAFANGSFAFFVDVLFGAGATCVCASETTGTRRVTVGAAA